MATPDAWKAAFQGHARSRHAFLPFHAAHPEVYLYLFSLVRQLWNKGFRHCGIRTVWEHMRWHFQVEQGQGEDFKLNDRYVSRYVRLLIAENPEFDGMFELRALRRP